MKGWEPSSAGGRSRRVPRPQFPWPSFSVVPAAPDPCHPWGGVGGEGSWCTEQPVCACVSSPRETEAFSSSPWDGPEKWGQARLWARQGARC